MPRRCVVVCERAPTPKRASGDDLHFTLSCARRRHVEREVADIFLSYKREEQARVAELAGILEDLKLSVWYDVGLSSGDQWAQEIEQQALLAKALVVCWSQLSSFLRECRCSAANEHKYFGGQDERTLLTYGY